ncbi:MAG: Sybindin-like family-domain-containing protein [Benjaminiella poitrasii]|nr:MAG: Sybindin-like family-domain-containing protein [Benjaminiella poitrasii]
MTIYNLYIFDRHCQCIYFQKWTHNNKASSNNTNLSSSNNGTSNTNSQLGHSSSRLGGLTTSSSRFSTSSAASSVTDHNSPNNLTRNGDDTSHLQSQTGITQQSGLAAGSVISIEEEAKLVYGVILSLRNFVRKLSGSQDGFISYKTSTYRLHYYETPTGLKFVMNSDPNTENLRIVLKQIYIQLYVEFVVKNGLMRFDDTRWEISQGFLQNAQSTTTAAQDDNMTAANTTHTSSSVSPPPPGNISNELFRIAVDRFIRSLKSFE